jgi:hypothetical protein
LNSDTSGSPCLGDPEASAFWTIRKGTDYGRVVASGEGGCPNWSGINDVVVPASPDSYYVIVFWWDSENGYYDATEFPGIYVTTAGQIIQINY